METETKTCVVKVKPSSSHDGSAKGKVAASVTKRNIVGSTGQPADSMQKSPSSTVIKTEVKSKTTSVSSKTKTTTTTKAREKKVYTLPGQKYDTPEEREPLRIFYESLSEQIPSSEMAEFWMMEHGLLSPDRAKRAHEKKQKRQKQLRMGTPIKSPPTPSKPETSHKQQQALKNSDIKAKKRILKESDDEEMLTSLKQRKKG